MEIRRSKNTLWAAAAGALIVVLSRGCGVAGDAHPFDYSNGPYGPDNWGKMYSECAGKFQSPINIDQHEVLNVKLPPLRFQGFNDELDDVKLTNNGHTVMLSLEEDDAYDVKVQGGPLKGPYVFKQMHFHWGFNDSAGSEDSINNQSFPMELHMVFWKESYGTYDKALEHKDGLTVLAFFYEITMFVNEAYKPLVDALQYVEKHNSKKTISDFTSLNQLLPFDRIHYYYYSGSLTTPPCNEIVTWIDFQDPIALSHHQINKFRKLMDQNHRPTQPIGDRTIWFNIGPGEELVLGSYNGCNAPYSSLKLLYLIILIFGFNYYI